ncbi:helix-turn-helix domain-containing protein [Mesorhizobium sp. KR9-304]|uniref:helix-turn-helix transcriptional regulator n=1 Tax=Mesorhizobium sp. KR9-304 TaxID=3156614 RepID=UPI0032B3C3D0
MIIPTASGHVLRTEAAASMLGISTSTLAKMRMRGDGPPFMKMGRRLIVYKARDLDQWLEETRRTSTSQL